MRKLVRFWAPDRFQFSDQSTQQIANFRSSFPINLPITFPITASACLQPPAVLRSAPALQASCLGWLRTPPSDLVPIRPPHVALHRLAFRGVSVPFRCRFGPSDRKTPATLPDSPAARSTPKRWTSQFRCRGNSPEQPVSIGAVCRPPPRSSVAVQQG